MPFLKIGVSLRLSLLKKQLEPARSDWNVHLLSGQILRITDTLSGYFAITLFFDYLRHQNIYTINFYK